MQSQAGSGCHLLEHRPCDFFPVGGEDLKVVDANLLSVAVGPHHLFVSGHFKQFWSIHVRSPAGVAGDDKVAIGKQLSSARILQPFAGKVLVGQRPDHVAV